MTRDAIIKRCPKCHYTERLAHSSKNTYFVNNTLLQRKHWAGDDNRKQLLQPLDARGNANEDFTEAFGYNPYDERTKDQTPAIQGGNGL